MSKTSKTLAALVLLLAIPTFGQGRRGQPPRGGGGLYDPATYSEGLRAAEEGDMIGALEGFCDMLAPLRGQSLWTVSVVLLCDASEVPKALEAIAEPQPVFVVKRVFEGRVCFRICAGLTTDRREAVGMRVRLPEAFKDAGPFPVEVNLPCDPSLPGFVRPPKAAAEVPAPKVPAPTGPDVVELTPVLPPQPVPAPPEEPQPAPAADPPEEPAQPGSPFVQQRLDAGPGLPGTPSPPPPPPPTRRPEAEAWFQRGVNAYTLGDRKLAEACYRECLALEPDKPEALTNLGILYIEAKNTEEARGLFERALERAPSYSRAHLGLAGSLWAEGEHGEALEQAKSAVDLDGNDVSARLTYASFLRAVGREEEAMQQARMVLLIEPNNRKATDFVNTPPPKRPIKLKEKKEKKEKKSRGDAGEGDS